MSKPPFEDALNRPITRRRLLSASARAAAASLAASLMPANVRRALAQPVRTGQLSDIKHVVLLMQENRSFDHYFGTMAGVRGFNDPDALRLPNGRSVFYQPDAEHPDGHMLPFHLDTRTTNAQKIPSTSHAWSVQHEAWNNGKMDHWLPAHRKADGANGPYVMGYYTRADIPFQFALAEAFTICDASHCSVLGPTWPNRMYWMTGTIDPEGKGGGPIINNTIPHDRYYHWTTYAERLEQAGVSWKVYQQTDNYGCNVLEYFEAFGRRRRGSPLYAKGVARGPEGQFESDAINDRLPTVSWIMPTSCAVGASQLHAGRRRGVRRQQDRRDRREPRRLGEDGVHSHVRRERRPLRPRRAAGAARGHAARVRARACRSAPAFASRRSSSRRGPRAAGCRANRSTTRRRCGSSSASPGVQEPNITEWRRKTFGDCHVGVPVRRREVGAALAARHQWTARAGASRGDVAPGAGVGWRNPRRRRRRRQERGGECRSPSVARDQFRTASHGMPR